MYSRAHGPGPAPHQGARERRSPLRTAAAWHGGHHPRRARVRTSAASPRAWWAASSAHATGGSTCRSPAWASSGTPAKSWCPASPGRCSSPCAAPPRGRRSSRASCSRPPWARAPGGWPTRARTRTCEAPSPSRSRGRGGWASSLAISSAPTAAPPTGSAARPSIKRCAPIPTRWSCSSCPRARAKDVLGEWLLAEREAFVSRNIFGSFGRYALSQLHKLSSSPAPGRAPRSRPRLAVRGAHAGSRRGGPPAGEARPPARPPRPRTASSRRRRTSSSSTARCRTRGSSRPTTSRRSPATREAAAGGPRMRASCGPRMPTTCCG